MGDVSRGVQRVEIKKKKRERKEVLTVCIYIHTSPQRERDVHSSRERDEGV